MKYRTIECPKCGRKFEIEETCTSCFDPYFVIDGFDDYYYVYDDDYYYTDDDYYYVYDDYYYTYISS